MHYICPMRISIAALLSLSFLFNQAQSVHVTLDNKNNPNEPSIAQHPITKTIVAASNINNFYVESIGSNSFSKIISTSPLGIYGDPVLHYSDTMLYFAHLAKTPKKEYGAWFDRIVVQKIMNPHNWKEKSYSVGYNGNKMQDKPWLSSDNHSAQYNGNLYVTWTEFDKYGSDNQADRSRIRFSKYNPKSDSFSSAVTISDTTGDCLDSDNTLEGATTAVGKNGEIYAVWAGYESVWVDKSSDGGLTWGEDQIIAFQPGGWNMDMPHIMRANGMPFIASDTVNDIQYVTWADEFNGNADVWLMYSKDQGSTWSERINVSKDTTNGHQYFPNLTIDQKSGEVFIAYYDFSESPHSIFYKLAVSKYSLGNDFELVYLNQNPIHLPGKNVFYGDYLDIDVQDGEVAIVYTSNNFRNETSIEMSRISSYFRYEENIDPKTAYNNIALLDEADSLSLWINTFSPFHVCYKIKVKCADEKVKVYKGRSLYEAKIHPKDKFIVSIKKPKKACTLKIKVVVREKLSHKKQKHLFFKEM